MQNFDEEISLRDLILKIKEYLSILFNKKWWIVSIALLAGVLSYVNAYLSAPTYSADITFMVNEDNGAGGGGGGAAAAVLGQFGFGGKSSEFNLDKIVALSKSQSIISKALIDSSNNPLIGNEIITHYDLHKDWEDSDLLKDYNFGSNSKNESFHKAIRAVSNRVKGNEKVKALLNTSYEEETGILRIRVNTVDAKLSYRLAYGIYEQLSCFYIMEATEGPSQNFKLLSQRADSVYNELMKLQKNIARLQDRSQSLFLKNDQLKLQDLRLQAEILATMYGEIVKNRETAQFILKTKTPFFQVVDRTQLPISSTPKALKRKFAVGAILGGLLTAFGMILFYMYNEVMRE